MLVNGNDYLHLANHPTQLAAKITSLNGGDNELFMSGVFLPGENSHRRFERDLADHISMEDALVCPSGYCANVGVVQVVA